MNIGERFSPLGRGGYIGFNSTMRTPSVLLVSALLCATAVAVLPTPLQAQETHAVGGFVGSTDSWQTWAGHPAARHLRGFEIGGFADVQSPVPGISLISEIAFVQRGARLPLGTDATGKMLLGDVRVDFLSVALLPGIRFGHGAVHLFGYAGPALDINVHSTEASALATVYQHNDRAQVLVGEAGGGLEVLLWHRWALRAEIRQTTDLTAAYVPASGDIRFHSTEILFRFGVHPHLPKLTIP